MLKPLKNTLRQAKTDFNVGSENLDRKATRNKYSLKVLVSWSNTATGNKNKITHLSVVDDREGLIEKYQSTRPKAKSRCSRWHETNQDLALVFPFTLWVIVRSSVSL